MICRDASQCVRKEIKELEELSLRSSFGQGVKANTLVDVFLSRSYRLTGKACDNYFNYYNSFNYLNIKKNIWKRS